MQALKLLLLVFLLPLNLKAELLFSDLNLKLYDNTSFNVVLDNNSYPGSNNFCARSLFPGNHFLQIYRSGNILTYCGVIYIPSNSEVFAFIDSYNYFNIAKVLTLGNCSMNRTFNNQTRILSSGQLNQFDFFSSDSFDHLMEEIAKVGTSNIKLQIIKQGLTFNKVTAEQVAGLMLLLDFDNERLDLAKYAYNFTADKENYYKVYDSFIFSANIKELNKQLYTYY